jgi:hypothetical protein
MIIIKELYNTRGVIEIMGRNIMKNKSILLVLMLLIPIFFSAFQAAPIEIIETNKKTNISSLEPISPQATVYFQQYDPKHKEIINEPFTTISSDEAYHIREELLKIEKTNLSALEKIQAQIKKLREYNLLPESLYIEKIQNQIISLNDNNQKVIPTQADGVSPNVIICGPAITSFLTIGGPILPLHVLLFNVLRPFWYNTSSFESDFANGALVSGFLGLLPVVAFYCSTTTIINAYGAVLGENTVISPFIALMILHAGAGVSISINSDGFPINIFDWAIGLSVTGLVAYIDIA